MSGKLQNVHIVEYSTAVKMNELWLQAVIQTSNITMNYKSKSKTKKQYDLHRVYAQLNNFVICTTITIVRGYKNYDKIIKKSKEITYRFETAVATKEGRKGM